MSSLLFVLLLIVVLLAVNSVSSPIPGVQRDIAERALPTPIAVSTAKSYLSEREYSCCIRSYKLIPMRFTSAVIVAVDSNSPAYARDLFKTWDISACPNIHSHMEFAHPLPVSGKCDTRETVLKRDGTSVITDSNCASVSGHWVSPYDGVPTDSASDLDIVCLDPHAALRWLVLLNDHLTIGSSSTSERGLALRSPRLDTCSTRSIC
jgi:hypothetical protein